MIATYIDKLLENKVAAWVLCISFLIAGLILASVANGTCDGGDSVMHYQFARWSWKHPVLLLDHWAKPLFVLLASPSAQGGMLWMKIFNLLISTATVFCTYYIADALHIKRKVFVIIALLFSPAFIVHALSGLTEPMFALALAAGVLLYLKNRITVAIIVVSFMPFIRSEGLIICGVFGTLLLIERRWLMIPLLAVGHMVYSLVGAHRYGILWVFTKIPYARLSSAYGKGTWEHFFINMPFVIGVPLYALLTIGLLYGLHLLLKRNSWASNAREIFLVYAIFISFFMAHVVFWALGIFNSFGLMRVLVGVLPLAAIIQLRGFNTIVDFIKAPTIKALTISCLILAVIIFPFTGTKYGWSYKRDFCLHFEQQMQQDMADYVKQHYPDYKEYRYYYDANFISVVLDFDYFDDSISLRTWQRYEVGPKPKSFLIWDEWYSAVETKVLLEDLQKDERFREVKQFATHDEWGYEKKTVLFEAIPERL